MQLGIPKIYTPHKLVLKPDLSKIPSLPGTKNIHSDLKMTAKLDLSRPPVIDNGPFIVRKFLGKVSELFKNPKL